MVTVNTQRSTRDDNTILLDAIAACESVQISILEFSRVVYIAARIATISASVEEGECETNVALKESKGQF
ncbi:718_t:CDS:2 [Funneliformis caledonium]|uniref:718_t:CDS:1 n=1 Tax=Funneliformis caledonium TaxID=1117310 RepID=A0A9N9GDZ0_9GLOM|nr:718_t:CDS:2 [Funneliformis caledonium]